PRRTPAARAPRRRAERRDRDRPCLREPPRCPSVYAGAVIHDAELFSVGPDEVVVTFRTDGDDAVTTAVGGREVTTNGRYHSARITGLEPETPYELQVDGVDSSALLPAAVTTLPRPTGRLLATFATANDVHFGETQCGLLGTPGEIGPVFASEPGDD